MTKQEPSPRSDELLAEIASLRDEQRSVILATVAQDGEPNASYAPYVRTEEGHFLILVSGLARHCRDLLETSRASLLFIESESEARQVFARRRLIYQCAVVEVAGNSVAFDEGVHALSERFGAIVDTLRSLPDFRLFRLEPETALYVRGFGEAFELKGTSPSQPHRIQPRGGA